MKGAFTGAVFPKKGLFELADKGTIFFDEIGNVPLETVFTGTAQTRTQEYMKKIPALPKDSCNITRTSAEN